MHGKPDNELPMSENVASFEAGRYFVTAAVWRGLMGESFEIGIRRKEDGEFWLLQSNKYNHQSVQEVANAIAHLIGMPDISGEHYDPEWCQKYLT